MGLVDVGLLLQPIHFHAESGFRDSGLALLRQVELSLLLKTRARVTLVEGLVLGPFLGELLGEAEFQQNWAGQTSGLLVLRAGRRRVRNLTQLECLVEAVELLKDEFVVAVVLGACGLGLRVCDRMAAALPPAPSSSPDSCEGCAAAG